MITHIDDEIIHKSIIIEDKRLILIDSFDSVFGDEVTEYNRNMFLIDSSGQVIWRVSSDYDIDKNNYGKLLDNPFIDIYSHENGQYKAYRWDSFEYSINMESGFATIVQWLK